MNQPRYSELIYTSYIITYCVYIITINENDYIKTEAFVWRGRPPIFYLLPKVHKDLGTWTVPNQIPHGRTIVSDCVEWIWQNSQFHRLMLTRKNLAKTWELHQEYSEWFFQVHGTAMGKKISAPASANIYKCSQFPFYIRYLDDVLII